MVEELHQHILRLCAEHSISFRYVFGVGRAFRVKRHVEIRYVTDLVRYAVALHEIGHLLGENQRGDCPILIREAWAWQWAESNALIWTPVMINHRAQCLTQHLAAVKARKRRSKDAAIPPDNDLFWQMMSLAEEKQ